MFHTKTNKIMVHELKIYPMYFREIENGNKTFEIRNTIDRDFQLGDDILFREFCPKDYFEEGDNEYFTGRILHRKISYIMKGPSVEFGICKDFAIMGLKKV